MEAYAEIAEQAARQAGAILRDWAGRVQAREKGPADLVTQADLESQQAIQQFLHRACPEIDFLGEEDPQGLERVLQRRLWIVDPLDGTTNFVHGLPAYCVSIALCDSGQPLVGVVYDPIRDEMFRALRGGGAWLNGEKLVGSRCQQLQQALVAASFSNRVSRDSTEIDNFLNVLTHSRAVRRWGAAALNLAYVAAGRLDAYWATSTKAWDVAAGILLVTEAGGRLSNLQGQRFCLSRPDFIVAATSELSRELQGVLIS